MIDHSGFTVGNYARSLEFYRRALARTRSLRSNLSLPERSI